MPTRTTWSIGISAGVIVLFCASFVFFYSRSQQKLSNSKSGIGKELPAARLTDLTGQPVDDQVLHKGKVLLVFLSTDCGACQAESEFLKGVVNRRSDVTFYGLVAFGQRSEVKDGGQQYPFKLLFDEAFFLAPKLGVNRVPVKVYLENGVITKVWGGATIEETKKADFVKWLDSV